MQSYLNNTLFYLIPFATTTIFSVLLYPRAVYLVKKTLKFKSFYSINLGVLPIMLFMNVRVFALVQTYVGFKLIEKAYRETININKTESLGEFHGKHYKILKEKIVNLK